jgi:hypothetical protein
MNHGSAEAGKADLAFFGKRKEWIWLSNSHKILYLGKEWAVAELPAVSQCWRCLLAVAGKKHVK